MAGFVESRVTSVWWGTEISLLTRTCAFASRGSTAALVPLFMSGLLGRNSCETPLHNAAKHSINAYNNAAKVCVVVCLLATTTLTVHSNLDLTRPPRRWASRQSRRLIAPLHVSKDPAARHQTRKFT